jgi:hypothetical protein
VKNPPPVKNDEPVKATVVDAGKINNEVPKKLVVSDVFKSQPKAPEFPPKKDEPKKLNNPFEKKPADP